MIDLALHSTMFLLIRLAAEALKPISDDFTFHYVSINTDKTPVDSKFDLPLHSTMFLLIHRRIRFIQKMFETLHSTMFLLILKPAQFFDTF